MQIYLIVGEKQTFFQGRYMKKSEFCEVVKIYVSNSWRKSLESLLLV